MKYLLAVLLMAAWIPAHATNFGNPKGNSGDTNITNKGGEGGHGGTGVGLGVGVGTGGNSDLSLNIEGDDVKIPKIANTAIAPSVSQNTICPIVSPSSKAGSVFFFSGSGTTGTTVNGICVAWQMKDLELVHQIACSEDSTYRKASNKLGRICD